MSSKALKIIGIGLVLGAAFFFFKRSREPEVVKKTSVVTAPKSAPRGQTLSSPEVAQSQQSIQEARKAYTRMASLGVQIIPTQKRASRLEMKIGLTTPSAGCGLGEFDLMKNIAREFAEKNLLLTLEDPLSSDKPIFAQRLSVLDISDQPLLLTSVPAFEGKSAGLILSVCADDKKENTCRTKKVLKGSEWQTQMSDKKTHDFLFYVQFLVINNSVAYLIPTHKWDDKTLATIKTNIANILPNRESFETFVPKLKTIAPLPARVNNRGLVVGFPARADGC